MFSRLKRVENKIDQFINNQKTQTNMIVSLLDIIDQKQSKNADQKKALSNYVANISGMLESKGAPPEFVNSIKDLFDQNLKM